MKFDEPTLAQVTIDVCVTMLELPISAADVNAPVEAGLVASVQISGARQATVQVTTGRRAARIIAAQMFAISPEQVDPADMCDALGELANMVGGNLKGIADSELDLSLPTVGEQGDAFDEPTDGTISVRLSCAGSPIMVRLFESAPCSVG